MPRYIDPTSGLLMTRREYLEALGRDDPFPALAHRDEPPLLLPYEQQQFDEFFNNLDSYVVAK